MLAADFAFRRGGFNLRIAFEQTRRITGVFGPSGCGKTTLLNCIAGLLRPECGFIKLGERTLFDRGSRMNVPAHRRRVGVVFQDDRLLPHRTVAGNLKFAQHLAANRKPVIEFDHVTRLMELTGFLDQRPGELSGGQRQRVALARALFSAPQLLLLDEPLSSLDENLKQQVLPLLRRIPDAANVPMLYVSHDLREILQITDQLLLMDAGRIIGHGSFHELARDAQTLPAMHGSGLLNILSLRVVAHDREAGMTQLALPPSPTERASGQLHHEIQLAAPLHPDASVGHHVQVTLGPADIALAAQRIEGVSIRNQLHGKVSHIARLPGRAIIEMNIGVPLLVEVSLQAVSQMHINVGRELWCLIKSNAIRYTP